MTLMALSKREFLSIIAQRMQNCKCEASYMTAKHHINESKNKQNSSTTASGGPIQRQQMVLLLEQR